MIVCDFIFIPFWIRQCPWNIFPTHLCFLQVCWVFVNWHKNSKKIQRFSFLVDYVHWTVAKGIGRVFKENDFWKYYSPNVLIWGFIYNSDWGSNIINLTQKLMLQKFLESYYFYYFAMDKNIKKRFTAAIDHQAKTTVNTIILLL